jgi:hypothetical protein
MIFKMKLNLKSALVLLVLLYISLACSNQKQINNNEEQKLTPKEVIEKHSAELMAIDGVEGVYESADDSGNPIIKIMVSSEDREFLDSLPKELGGYDVELIVSGEIKPL